MAFKQLLEFVVDVDDKATSKFKSMGSSASSSLDGITTKTKGIGGAFESAAAKSPLLTGALDKVGVSGAQAGSMVASALPGAMLVAGGAVAAFGVKAFGTFQDLAGSVLDFQRIVGGTAEESSAFVAVLDDYEISAEAGAAAIGKMAKVAANTPAAFEKFGVEIAKNADGTTNLQETLLNAAEAYQNTGDDATKAALGAALFGKGYATLIPILEKGADGANGLQEAFAGVAGQQILSQGQIDQAEETRLALDELGDSVGELSIALGSGLSPAVGKFASGLSDVLSVANKALGPVGGLDSAIGFMVESALSGGPVLKELREGIEGLVAPTETLAIGTGFAADAIKAYEAILNPTVGSVNALENALGLEATAHSNNAGQAAADTIAIENKAVADEVATEKADAHTAALQAQTDAANALFDATNKLIGGDLALRDATDATEEAVAAQSEALMVAAAAGYSDATANEALDDATRAAEHAIINEAAAAVSAAEDNANLAGKTLTAAEKARVQRDALEQLKNKFPELASVIQGHIDKLNAIPDRKTTFVDTIFTEQGHAAGGGRASVLPAGGFFGGGGGAAGPVSNTNTSSININVQGNIYGDEALRRAMDEWGRSIVLQLNAGPR